MFNKMNFENYQDYLLSINIAQINREYGFKKIGMNSLYLLTQVLKACNLNLNLDIEDLAVTGREYCELTGRSEPNLIDILFSLSDRDITKEGITTYMKESKLKHQFAKQSFLGKIYSAEEKERNALIKKNNLNNVIKTESIPENILAAIPKALSIFPRDFALKETEAKTEVEENKKIKISIKGLEKKSLEDIISSTNYHDFSKKHTKRKASIEISNLFSDIIKTENINLGKKFKPATKIDKDIQNLRQEDNFIGGINMNEEKNHLIIGVNLESEINDKSNYLEDSNI